MKKSIYLLILAIFFFSSCEKENNSDQQLDGMWVETSLRKDTIIFKSSDPLWGGNWFELKRDVMLSTGPYEYTLSADSISLHWMLSSASLWQTYYFQIDRDEFLIGKFYDSELDLELLRFKKIKD
jgi:hypothetical protein